MTRPLGPTTRQHSSSTVSTGSCAGGRGFSPLTSQPVVCTTMQVPVRHINACASSRTLIIAGTFDERMIYSPNQRRH
jgi:hypothetical protein